MSHGINETLEDGLLIQDRYILHYDNIQTWLKHFIKCGSELKVSSYCQLCQEPLIFACTSCDYITEEKVHTDCRNAEVLAKTVAKEGAAAAAITPTSTTGNQEVETIADKPKEEETVKAEPSSASSYMTREQDTKNFSNVNPFVAGTEFWQSIMTYWLNAYEEFLKNAPKIAEDWYDVFWKLWLNWAPQQLQRQQEQQQQGYGLGTRGSTSTNS